MAESMDDNLSPTDPQISPLRSSAKSKITTSSGKIISSDFLRITNKVRFVDGTIEKPDRSSPHYKPWVQCNAIVMCWLFNSMTEELSKRVMFAETTHEAWKNLRMTFVPSVDLKIYQIHRRLAGLTQCNDTMDKYFGKLNKAWMELSEYDPVPKCSCGGCNCETTKRAEEARENEQCYAFLMGLNTDLDSVGINIMLKKSPPSLFDALVMAEQAESRMKQYMR